MAQRRIALRTLLTLVAMALMFAAVAGQASAAKAPKVGICHWSTDLDEYVYINVSANAVKAHEAHQGGKDIIPATQADCAPTPPPQCSDGIDNDGDLLIDYPADLGCDSAADDNEVNAQPCNSATTSGGDGVTTTVHQLGQTSGTFNFFYEAYSVPDQFDITYEGNSIFTTGGPVSGNNGTGQPVNFGPGSSTEVTVTVTGGVGTLWDYRVDCPTPPA